MKKKKKLCLLDTTISHVFCSPDGLQTGAEKFKFDFFILGYASITGRQEWQLGWIGVVKENIGGKGHRKSGTVFSISGLSSKSRIEVIDTDAEKENRKRGLPFVAVDLDLFTIVIVSAAVVAACNKRPWANCYRLQGWHQDRRDDVIADLSSPQLCRRPPQAQDLRDLRGAGRNVLSCLHSCIALSTSSTSRPDIVSISRLIKRFCVAGDALHLYLRWFVTGGDGGSTLRQTFQKSGQQSSELVLLQKSSQ